MSPELEDNDQDPRIINEYPQTIAGLAAAFRKKRGYDPFFLIGQIDEEIAAEDDLEDIYNGEYVPEEPGYEQYCRGIVTSLRERIIKLIEDDTYYAQEVADCAYPGFRERDRGPMRAAIDDALNPPESSVN